MKVSYFLTALCFCTAFFSFAQPKLEDSWKDNHLNETLETPLGFLRKEKTTVNKVDYFLGVDKNNKIKYIETSSSTFKVGTYNLTTKLFDFKNYTYTRYFDGWGYYLRINPSWCAYFGKGKPTKDSRPIFYFNYDFGKAEGKPIFDANYEEVLAAQQKAEKEKAEKKAKEEERKRKSEEFRTGQRVVNTELAEAAGSTTTSSTSEALQGGEKLLDENLKTKIKKSLRDYQAYIKKNQKRTEAYPLVLINYKDVMDYPQSELAKISKIVSTTVFKKGAPRTTDFKEKGQNGVVIIKVEFK